MNLSSRQVRTGWQVRTTLLIATLGPPVASLIVMTATYLPYGAALHEPIDIPSFVVAFTCFALPVGYAFGVVPALLAGAVYCAALTAVATLRPGMLLRGCLGAISGGLAGGVWFHAVVGPDSHGYGSVAALVMALLSLSYRQSEHGNSAIFTGASLNTRQRIHPNVDPPPLPALHRGV